MAAFSLKDMYATQRPSADGSGMNQSCVRSEPRLGAPSCSSYRAGPQTRSSAGTPTGRRVPFGLVSPKMDAHKSAYAWDARPKFDAVGSKLSRCVHSGTSTDGSASHSKLTLTRADSGLPGTSVYRCALFRDMSEARATRSKDGHCRLEVMDHAPGMASICRLDDSRLAVRVPGEHRLYFGQVLILHDRVPANPSDRTRVVLRRGIRGTTQSTRVSPAVAPNAIHVASALITRCDVVLTRDRRMARACEEIGLAVA